jgi:alkanesulfonate monooxygenase SsuD/methylene tetrahydromethanopterin reductase-like flavin-dependent oxidoreductase (luciferase family)
MRFGAAFWVNRTTWSALRDVAGRVEAAGFDSLWADDHLLADEGDWTDPKFEGWLTLAAWAQLTTRVRLGLLVGANTFRNPGLTAKLATTLDHLSDGRAILGLGGGWFEREHEAFGIDFGAGFGERLDRLDEAVGLMRRLLDGERVTHDGPTYHFRDAVIAPRPIQPRLPILIGGSGPRKTLLTTARSADIWNGYGDPARIADRDAILRAHCATIGRDEREIARTVAMDVVIRDDPAAALAAYEAVAVRHGIVDQVGSDGGRRDLTLWGSPATVAEGVRGYAEVGVSEVIWIFRDPFDLETIERLGEVRAALGG